MPAIARCLLGMSSLGSERLQNGHVQADLADFDGSLAFTLPEKSQALVSCSAAFEHILSVCCLIYTLAEDICRMCQS